MEKGHISKSNYGYFVLLINDVKYSMDAIEIYHNKDLVKRSSGTLRNI
ncbi:MAG TPA: hypothetical protein VIK72_03020 [Clostridiaceae bacterium]